MEEKDAAKLAERVRPLVNEILADFNTKGVTPQEAGMIILALTHRLMSVLSGNPDEQRIFILHMVNLVNNYLAGNLQEE
ncbi:MAG: hypothetical protein QME75_04300 [Deltaproteobacteria bacterium]|nr:hypothetical protein [Deltaproteobacteria bacterium]